mmetsp:Transcript_39268/g.97245  ORF Transcript_39268/g.97245 Transcript_39268/m.97245 type:complete len:317 (+) Transcript_39268:421-1371(+)
MNVITGMFMRWASCRMCLYLVVAWNRMMASGSLVISWIPANRLVALTYLGNDEVRASSMVEKYSTHFLYACTEYFSCPQLVISPPIQCSFTYECPDNFAVLATRPTYVGSVLTSRMWPPLRFRRSTNTSAFCTATMVSSTLKNATRSRYPTMYGNIQEFTSTEPIPAPILNSSSTRERSFRWNDVSTAMSAPKNSCASGFTSFRGARGFRARGLRRRSPPPALHNVAPAIPPLLLLPLPLPLLLLSRASHPCCRCHSCSCCHTSRRSCFAAAFAAARRSCPIGSNADDFVSSLQAPELEPNAAAAMEVAGNAWLAA